MEMKFAIWKSKMLPDTEIKMAKYYENSCLLSQLLDLLTVIQQ